jgi:hypothetical protein
MENNLPHWLQKELDQFGVFGDELPAVIKPKRKYPEPTGWMPSYLGEQPPF